MMTKVMRRAWKAKKTSAACTGFDLSHAFHVGGMGSGYVREPRVVVVDMG